MADQDRIEEFKEVVEIMPDDPVVRFGLAGAYLDAGQADAAVVEYGEAIRLKADYSAARRARDRARCAGAGSARGALHRGQCPGAAGGAEPDAGPAGGRRSHRRPGDILAERSAALRQSPRPFPDPAARPGRLAGRRRAL